METPFTNHITTKEFEEIYEPAEDTFLMLDTLESELDFIENKLKPIFCLEIGSGSGIVITAISKRLKTSCICLATDINQKCCIVSNRTSVHNVGNLIDSINMNLASGFRSNLLDMIIFNPPYVLTSQAEAENVDKNLIVYSWAGGTDGCVIINKFIEQLDFMLSSCGVAYLLVLKENNPQKIMKTLKYKKFLSEIIKERRILGEHLYVLKIIRAK